MEVRQNISKANESLVQELFANVATIRRLMGYRFQQLYANDGTSTQKATTAQGELLFVIVEHQPIALKELAKKMQLTAGAITQMIEGLERIGYVARAASPTDGRSTLVSATELGMKKLLAFKKQHRDIFKQITARLSEEELRTMHKIQQKMIDFLKEPIHETTQHAQKDKE